MDISRTQMIVVEPVSGSLQAALIALKKQGLGGRLDVVAVSSFEEASQLVQFARYSIVAISIRDVTSLAPAIVFVKSLSARIEAKVCKVVAVNSFASDRLTKALETLKLSSVVTEPVAPRTLMFKLILQIKALELIRKELELKAKRNELVEIKSDSEAAARAGDESIRIASKKSKAEEKFVLNAAETAAKEAERNVGADEDARKVWQKKAIAADVIKSSEGEEQKVQGATSTSPAGELGRHAGAKQASADSVPGLRKKPTPLSDEEIALQVKAFEDEQAKRETEKKSIARAVQEREAKAESLRQDLAEKVSRAKRVHSESLTKAEEEASAEAREKSRTDIEKRQTRARQADPSEALTKEKSPSQPGEAAASVEAKGAGSNNVEDTLEKRKESAARALAKGPTARPIGTPTALEEESKPPSDVALPAEKKAFEPKHRKLTEESPSKENAIAAVPKENASSVEDSTETQRPALAENKRKSGKSTLAGMKEALERIANANRATQASRERLARGSALSRLRDELEEELPESSAEVAKVDKKSSRPSQQNELAEHEERKNRLDSEAEQLTRPEGARDRRNSSEGDAEGGEEDPHAHGGAEGAATPARKRKLKSEVSLERDLDLNLELGNDVPENTSSDLATFQDGRLGSLIGDKTGDLEEQEIKWDARNEGAVAATEPEATENVFWHGKPTLTPQAGGWTQVAGYYFYLNHSVEEGISSMVAALPLCFYEGATRPRSKGDNWCFYGRDAQVAYALENVPAPIVAFLEKFLTKAGEAAGKKGRRDQILEQKADSESERMAAEVHADEEATRESLAEKNGKKNKSDQVAESGHSESTSSSAEEVEEEDASNALPGSSRKDADSSTGEAVPANRLLKRSNEQNDAFERLKRELNQPLPGTEQNASREDEVAESPSDLDGAGSTAKEAGSLDGEGPRIRERAHEESSYSPEGVGQPGKTVLAESLVAPRGAASAAVDAPLSPVIASGEVSKSTETQHDPVASHAPTSIVTALAAALSPGKVARTGKEDTKLATPISEVRSMEPATNGVTDQLRASLPGEALPALAELEKSWEQLTTPAIPPASGERSGLAAALAGAVVELDAYRLRRRTVAEEMALKLALVESTSDEQKLLRGFRMIARHIQGECRSLKVEIFAAFPDGRLSSLARTDFSLSLQSLLADPATCWCSLGGKPLRRTLALVAFPANGARPINQAERDTLARVVTLFRESLTAA